MNARPAAMLLFIAAAFALPGEAAYGLVFYLAVLPAAAWHCRHLARPGLSLGLALALIAWSGLTLVWGEDPGHRRAAFAFATVCTAAFVSAAHGVLADPVWRRRGSTLLVWAGTINAAGSLLLGLSSLLAGERILGWGVTRQPILGGAVMSLAYLTAFYRAGDPHCPPQRRRHYVAAAVVMAMFIFAMQSRGALLAASGGTLVLLAAAPWRRAAAFALAVAGIAWVFLMPAALRAQAAHLIMARGTSHRLEIWRVTWALIRQKPIFGHGLAANVPPSQTGFPHSLFLSLLFYSGAIGLLLFGALVILAAYRLARAPNTQERAWIVAICTSGLLAGLTDLGQITKGPGPIWFIVWLPLLLALSPPAAIVALRAPATPPPPPGAAKVVLPRPRNPARD